MKKVILFIALAAVFSISGFSQDYPDVGSWNTFNIEKTINSKFTLLFTEELRIKENFTRLNLFYTNLGVEYKLAKNFKAALVYRWIDKYQDDDSYSFRNRLMLDLTVKHKFGNVMISYRNRTQVEARDIYTSADGKMPEWYSRNKVGAKYDLGKRYTPFASAEFRYQLHDPRNIESDKTWHRDRFVLGAEYEINKRNTFSAYYLIQREFNVLSPQNLYIFGLEYTLTL
jgi:hypothetical protein